MLAETEARLPSKAMQVMRLQAGDTVLVAPAVQPLGQPTVGQAPPSRQRRSGGGGFWNNVVRFHVYQSMLGPRPYGGYNSGYGRRRSPYGQRGRCAAIYNPPPHYLPGHAPLSITPR